MIGYGYCLEKPVVWKTNPSVVIAVYTIRYVWIYARTYYQSSLTAMANNMVHTVALILSLVGALNWGLVGITSMMGTRFDLVEYLGMMVGFSMLSDIIYIIVGLSAIVVLVMMHKQ